MTSSTRAGSMPLRSRAALITVEASSAADMSRRPPPKLPTAVRTGETMATPRIIGLLVLRTAAGKFNVNWWAYHTRCHPPCKTRASCKTVIASEAWQSRCISNRPLPRRQESVLILARAATGEGHPDIIKTAIRGGLAQWESTCFASRGSGVRIP